MLIDWFTVAAQAVNFLILVGLLKRFLYKPILDAIDAREKRIATELTDAAAKKTEATREREDFEQKNKAFDDARGALLHTATDAANTERERLLGEARTAADGARAAEATALLGDRTRLGNEISRLAADEVFAIARKALADLATTSLEERLGEVFTRRLREMPAAPREVLGDALRSAVEPAVVRTAFDLSPSQHAVIQNALNETFSADLHIRFETARDVVCGIELTANGVKVGWSLRDYLAVLGRKVDGLLDAQASAATTAKPAVAATVGCRRGRCGVSEMPGWVKAAVERAFVSVGEARRDTAPELKAREVGAVASVSVGIARVRGLRSVGFEELVRFPGDLLGIAFNLDEEEIGVILLGEYEHLQVGDEVVATGRVMDVGVGGGLLGRVIDPLGHPLDGLGPLATEKRLPVERTAPAIMDRAPVVVPLQTGLKVVDALIPVGRGQRELILGDRQTGKTTLAIDTILNQRGNDVVCVYCAIGQRASAVAKMVATLRDGGALAYTIVVVAEGNRAPGLAYVAPYAATSIAEFFMEAGRDVLIVYDDLTHHARAYRELSLLLRRPPGREAFPGDIFYVHSRLLERSTHLSAERGGGSLTALPVIETEAQDIAAYIPTNLISITDGQIYLSPTLFELGVLPAVEIGKSVSRVGGAAQRGAYRSVAGALKLAYAQFEELENFARFGTQLDASTRHTIDHGQRIRACLKQSESQPLSLPQQIAVLLSLTSGLFDRVPIEAITAAEGALKKAAAEIPADVVGRFTSADGLSDDDHKAILAIGTRALAPFAAPNEVPAAAAPAP